MKITELETILVGEFPNLCYVRVHTDEGVSGLGETFFGAEAVSAWVHETAAAYLLGGSTLAAFAGGPGWPFRIATAAFVCAEAEEIAITLVLPRWHANVRSLTHALVLRRAAR